MAGYIVDTDVCIDFLKGQDYAKHLFENILKQDVFISILSEYELFKGAFTEKQRAVVKEFVSAITKLNLEDNIIEIGAEFYRKYRLKGITLGDIDCLIMATAYVYKLKIVTRNVKHYPEVNLLSEFSKGLIK